MRRLEKPIIGAINGVAAGAGISIALACDIIIAAENATFIEAFARVGLVPDTGSTWFLPRLVGSAKAAEMFFTADPVDAATAERIGLINRVVPADKLMDEANALATRLAQAAPIALALAKRALNRRLRHRTWKRRSTSRPSSSRWPVAPTTTGKAWPPSSRSGRRVSRASDLC